MVARPLRSVRNALDKTDRNDDDDAIAQECREFLVGISLAKGTDNEYDFMVKHGSDLLLNCICVVRTLALIKQSYRDAL